MAFKFWSERKITPVHVCPGDTFSLLTTDVNGDEVVILKETITEARIVTDAALIEITNEFGFKDGIMGVLGRKE